MTAYVDRFCNSAERLQRRISPDTDVHLARSCFAILLQQTHTQALESGESHDAFRLDIGSAIDELDLPIFSIVDSSKHLPGKRQPSLRESFDATLDRYEAIDELRQVFAGSAHAMIYGGSMKYGPFMNVRAGTDSSDIDAIVFTDEAMLDEIDWRGIMETDLFEEPDKITFFARLGLQRGLKEDNQVDITSQRFAFADGEYTLSAHFMPVEFMGEAYPTGSADSDRKSYHKYIRDYKERPFERTHVSNFGMDRRSHDVPVYNTPTVGGFIAANPTYSIVTNRYVPGMYQNLVLPNAKFILGQSSRAAEHLGLFSEAVARQEALEKQEDPQSSVLNTEPRMPIIAADVSDILSE